MLDIIVSLPRFDRTPKVTGGGNGLGRALCIELARHGCHVAIADVDLAGAEHTAQEVRRSGVKSLPYKVCTRVPSPWWHR